MSVTSLPSVPWIELHDRRGHVRFDVGDVTYVEKDDRYVQIEQLFEAGKCVAKVKYFSEYHCDPDTGIDFAVKNEFLGFQYVLCTLLPEPVIYSYLDNYIHFIGSLRFNLDFCWMSAHINGS